MKAKQNADNHVYARNSHSQKSQFYIWQAQYPDTLEAFAHSSYIESPEKTGTYALFPQASNWYFGYGTYFCCGFLWYDYVPLVSL
jgi:hypothetical protein